MTQKNESSISFISLKMSSRLSFSLTQQKIS